MVNTRFNCSPDWQWKIQQWIILDNLEGRKSIEVKIKTEKINRGIKKKFFFSMYCIQHCFICRPSDSTVSEDAGIQPRTVATSALAAYLFSNKYKSDALNTRLDLIHCKDGICTKRVILMRLLPWFCLCLESWGRGRRPWTSSSPPSRRPRKRSSSGFPI